MLLLAAERLGLDLSRSWVIGDAARDVEAGQRAGCRTVLFTPPGVPPFAGSNRGCPSGRDGVRPADGGRVRADP